MGIFTKKNNKKDNSTNVLNLKIGDGFEYDQKFWIIIKSFEYNWGDYKSLEFELECFGEIAFLEVELEDEMYMTFSYELDFNYLDKYLSEKISSNNIPQNIKYNNKMFFFDEESEGTCLNLQTGENDKVFCIDFYDKNDVNLISIEQWGQDDFTASYGKRVYEQDFVFQDNSNTKNRFA